MNYKFKVLKDEEISDNLDYVLFNLDFDRIQKVMEFLEWDWIGIEGKSPSNSELMYKVKANLLNAYAKLDTKIEYHYNNSTKLVFDENDVVEYTTSTGGFQYNTSYFLVSSSIQKDRHLYTEVNFILTGWHNHD